MLTRLLTTGAAGDIDSLPAQMLMYDLLNYIFVNRAGQYYTENFVGCCCSMLQFRGMPGLILFRHSETGLLDGFKLTGEETSGQSGRHGFDLRHVNMKV